MTVTVSLREIPAPTELASEGEDEIGAPPPYTKAKLLAYSAAGLTPGNGSELP